MGRCTMKTLCKYLILGLIGGVIYIIIELLYRGFSHWTMLLLGSFCFLSLGGINEFLSWETPLWKQSLIGGLIITILEFITGCIVNLWLGWGVWNYSDAHFNILGQVCISFFFIWCALSIVGIVLDDWLRYRLFGEEKPRYKII